MTTSLAKQNGHWLSLYGTKVFDWQRVKSDDGAEIYYRHQGIVENLFDSDGNDYEGRADIDATLHVELATSLNRDELQRRIALAWAVMRSEHVLLSCTSLYAEKFLPDHSGRTWRDKCFVYHRPRNVNEAVERAQKTITFVENEYPDVDDADFAKHVKKSARLFDSHSRLAKLSVLPARKGDSASGTSHMKVIFTIAHQIADGLTCYRWTSHFVDILNRTETELRANLNSICYDENYAMFRLPPAQESLYPDVAPTLPLLRWRWLLIRILRYVQKPTPFAFQNPLRHDGSDDGSTKLPKKYPKILNYDREQPLEPGTFATDLSKRATHNLARLCREAGISVGSGCFVIVALVMMRFEEIRHPDIPLQDRLPFVGSFPVNPRPSLTGTPTTGKEDSVMLAFSSGITLPFLPSHCDLATSVKVLGRLAHRQLRLYQKRKRRPEEETLLTSRSPSLLLPMLYLTTMDRLNAKVKPDQRVDFNPQGQYRVGNYMAPPDPTTVETRSTLATCGISSVGDSSGLVSRGKHDVYNRGDKDLVVDFRGLSSGVRAREGEFLVGAAGDKDTLGFMVSYDASSIDSKKTEEWRKMIQGMLDHDMPAASETRTTSQPKL